AARLRQKARTTQRTRSLSPLVQHGLCTILLARGIRHNCRANNWMRRSRPNFEAVRAERFLLNCNVLVLDPDEEFRARLAAALGARAYVVEEGEDGRAILTSTGPVAVLIVEILMPEQDGLEAIRSARA